MLGARLTPLHCVRGCATGIRWRETAIQKFRDDPTLSARAVHSNYQRPGSPSAAAHLGSSTRDEFSGRPLEEFSVRSGGGGSQARLAKPGKNWLRDFVSEMCHVSKQPYDWIDMRTRPAPPEGKLWPGMQSMVRLWCKERGLKPPQLDRCEWAKELPPGVTFKNKTRVRTISGIRFAKDKAPGNIKRLQETGRFKRLVGERMHRSWYVFEALAVLSHVVTFLFPALVLFLAGAYLQDEWACAVVPPHAGLHHPPLWHDLVQPLTFGVRYVGDKQLERPAAEGELHPLAAILIYTSMVKVCASEPHAVHRCQGTQRAVHHLRSLLHTVRAAGVPLGGAHAHLVPQPGRVGRPAGRGRQAQLRALPAVVPAPRLRRLLLRMRVGPPRDGALTEPHTMLTSRCVPCAVRRSGECTVCALQVLYPERYLPYGVAGIVILVAVQVVLKEMAGASQRLRTAFEAAVKRMLARKLALARDEIKKTARERLTAEHLEPGATHDDFDAPLGPMGVDHSGDDGVIDAHDIFTVLREARDLELGEAQAAATLQARLQDEGCDAIGKADFKRLFKALDLSLTDGQTDRLFAMTDLNASNSVSEEEFEGAWELLLAEMTLQAVREAGLTGPRIYFMVASVVVLLVLLFAFILLGLSSWLKADQFGALVQSGLVGFVGMAVTAARERSTAEQGKEQLDALVDEMIQQQEDDADGV